MTSETFPSKEVLIDDFTFNDIITGNAPGLSIAAHPATDAAVPAMAFKTTWGFSTAYTRLTVSEGFTVVSTSGLDTAAGTGARKVAVTYIREGDIVEVEDITMNGVTPVASNVLDILRVQSVVVIEAGSGEINAGDITVVGATSASNLSFMATDLGTSQDGIFTIPKGFNAYIHGAIVSLGDTTKKVTTRLRAGESGSPLIEVARFADEEGRDYVIIGKFIPELTDVIIESFVDTGTATIRLDPVIILIEITKYKSTRT